MITTKLPVDVGFPSKHNWAFAIIASFIAKEWEKAYTLHGVSRLSHDLGLSYTRPIYTLAKADPLKQKEFVEETFPSFKRVTTNHSYLWKHQGVKLIGTLNYETGELFCVEEERYDADAFLRFLQKVMERYPKSCKAHSAFFK